MTTTPTPRTDEDEIASSSLGIPGFVTVELARQLERENAELRAALRELVACKALHDQIDALDWSLYDLADAERANALQVEHDRRVSVAWTAASALLEPQ